MAALRRLANVISEGRSRKKAGPSKVTGLFFLVAEACYENYVQIEIEPFPLVV